MKPNTVSVTLLLDRSGSMDKIREETISGVNAFIEAQKKVPGVDTRVTLAQFDDQYQIDCLDTPIDVVSPLTTSTYVPRGWTALHDAIGRTINELGAKFALLSEDARPSKVIVVIVTDGMENSSKEFSKTKVNEMITHQKDRYGWDFVFLAANQDAIAAGATLGVNAGSTMSYAGTGVGVERAFTAAASYTASASIGAAAAFTDEQRAEQTILGAAPPVVPTVGEDPKKDGTGVA